MKKKMIGITGILLAMTILCIFIYYDKKSPLFLTLTISFGTTGYHFLMRLLVGCLIDCRKKNHWNYRRKWFREWTFEKRFYKWIRIKKWKSKMPTFVPEQFDISKHSAEEIVMGMCQAEVVHEVIMILSFLPVFMIKLVGSATVFWITSILAAMIDSIFVMLQRYNRPRMLKLCVTKSAEDSHNFLS